MIIDRNTRRVEAATKAGMLAVVADATRHDCLRRAGILRAAGFIAALPTEAENLYVILSERRKDPRFTSMVMDKRGGGGSYWGASIGSMTMLRPINARLTADLS